MHVYTTESETTIMMVILRHVMLLSSLLTYNNRECMCILTYDNKTVPEKGTSVLMHGMHALHGLFCFDLDTTCGTFWHIGKIWNVQHNAHNGTQEG